MTLVRGVEGKAPCKAFTVGQSTLLERRGRDEASDLVRGSVVNSALDDVALDGGVVGRRKGAGGEESRNGEDTESREHCECRRIMNVGQKSVGGSRGLERWARKADNGGCCRKGAGASAALYTSVGRLIACRPTQPRDSQIERDATIWLLAVPRSRCQK